MAGDEWQVYKVGEVAVDVGDETNEDSRCGNWILLICFRQHISLLQTSLRTIITTDIIIDAGTVTLIVRTSLSETM